MNYILRKTKAHPTSEGNHSDAASAVGICVFRCRVPEPTSTIVITADRDRVGVGYHGMVWADGESNAVMRFPAEWDPAAVW
jgi:hypothetical protein